MTAVRASVVALVSIVVATLTVVPAAAARKLAIPVVARAAGAGGTFFVTDVRLHNPTGRTISVDLVLTPDNPGDPPLQFDTTRVLAPHQSLAIDDVVGSVFDLGAVGWLELDASDDGLLATSRIYNQGTATYGQLVGAMPTSSAIGKGDGPVEVAYLEGWGEPGVVGFRTNVGVTEVTGATATVVIDVFDQDGAQLDELRIDLGPREHRQINDLFARPGLDGHQRARFEARVVSGVGKVFAYASVVDNLSSDQVFVPAIPIPDDGELWLAGVAHATGEGGTVWVTDLRLANPTATARLVELELVGAGTAAPVSYGVPAGGFLAVDDVVGSAFGVSGAGALRLSISPAGGIVAVARTFDEGGVGTYGQLLPALAPGSATTAGGVATALALEKSGAPGSGGFRSNVGLVDPSDDPVTATVEVRSSDGGLLGQTSVALEPHSVLRLNDVFAATGAAAAKGVVARFVPSGAGSLLAYASIVDNLSGDPIYVPALDSGANLPNPLVDLPAGWSQRLVVAKTQGATVAAALVDGDKAWVNWSLRNSGWAGLPAPLAVELRLDDVVLATQSVTRLDSGATAGPTFYPSFTATAGSHVLDLVLDPGGELAEENRADDTARLVFTVSPKLPDLAPTTPGGWSGPLVVTNAIGSTTDSTVFAGGTAFVMWAITNQGLVAAGAPFDVAVTLDQTTEIGRWRIDDLGVGQVRLSPSGIEFAVPSGHHTLTLRVDAGGEITESDESNGVVIRTFDWNGAPDLRPWTPDGWTAPLVVTTDPNGIVDTPVYDGSRIFYRYGVENVGTAASSSFWVMPRVDGDGQASQLIGSLPVDGTFSSDAAGIDLSSGSHTFGFDVDSTGSALELDETNNSYTRTITVTHSTSKIDLQPGADAPYKAAITATNVSGTTSTPDNLFAGTTYLSLYAKNYGIEKTSVPFLLGLDVDGTRLLTCEAPAGILPDRSGGCHDQALTISKGSHELHLVIDPDNRIAETVESNDELTLTLTWR